MSQLRHMTSECLHCVFTALSKEYVHASCEWNILTLNSCRGCTFVKEKVIQSNSKETKHYLCKEMYK
jgi:hypothetical protein